MRSLSRAYAARAAGGTAIPQPIEAIRQLGFVQRRGQLSLFVAAPGVGKSIVALHMALKCGIPTLVISADTDRSDQGERAMSILSGQPMSVIKEDPDKYVHVLRAIPDFVRFEFDSGPEAADLLEMTKAYAMVQGSYPHLIIVDTIGKIWSDTGDESGRLKDATDQCQQMARKTGAHVMALSHATKMFDGGNIPIPLDGILGGTSKLPEGVMTMFRNEAGDICFCPVKNRSGPMDATAMHLRSWAKFDPEAMTIGTVAPMEWRYQDDPELS